MTVADARLADILGHRDLFSASIVERYAAIVESSDDAIIGTGLDGTVVSWNPGAERMYGVPAEEALGCLLASIGPAGPSGETNRVLAAAARGEIVERVETSRTHRDGSRFDVSLSVSGIRNATGRVVGASLIARELRQSKSTEDLLRASRAEVVEANDLLAKAERLSRSGSWILDLGPEPSVAWSRECYRVLGLDDATPISLEEFFAFVHPEDRERVHEAMARAVRGRTPYEIEHRILCSDGSTRWLHVWAELEYDANGTLVRVLGVGQDITERYQADEALRASERRFRLLAENARDLIFRLALLPEPHYEYVSPASVAITGFTPEELYADPQQAMVLIEPDHVRAMGALFDAGGLSEPLDVSVRRKDGSALWVSQQLTFVRDGSGALVAVEGIIRDISERKRAEEKATYASLHDRITGLPNRLLLRDRVDLARSRARAERRSVIVVALDIDDFTLINDTHGQDTGDTVLIAVAQRLADATGGRASVARTGSDEFVVVGDQIGSDDDAVTFVERVRDALTQPISSHGVELFVHARIGVTVDNPDATSDNLLRNADIALARAKEQRTGPGVEFFNTDMRTRTDERFALVGDLHRALERDEFVLKYQPIVRLADGTVVGVEALIRWQHPRRGLMSPADFIPLTEETGLIVEVGAWVVASACEQLRRWSEVDPRLAAMGMSVNVSVKQLRAPGIVETIAAAIRNAGIEARRLTVEMTESVFADDLEAIREVLTHVRALGVRVAVDDFGTGYSSLAYLKHLPLDTLKIDRDFIEGLGSIRCDEAIVASALSVSRALGLFAVAEGVETLEQLAALRVLGCDAAQGYYFSKPVSEAELVEFVTKGPTP